MSQDTQNHVVAQGYEEEERPAIDLQPVESSQVKAIGYDAATHTLAVQFTRGAGAVYHYPDVTPELHAAFVSSESIGTFFGKHIKPLAFKKYPGTPVAAKPETEATSA